MTGTLQHNPILDKSIFEHVFSNSFQDKISDVEPAAAALPMAWRVDRPLLPTRLLPAPEAAAVPRPSEEDEDEDIDWFSIFCSTRPSSTSTSL